MKNEMAGKRAELRRIVLAALRCVATEPNKNTAYDCENCPYAVWETVVPGMEEYVCDCDRVASDGADIIENDLREIAALRAANNSLRERLARAEGGQ